ncbi:MAG: serine--tRNA ligase [Deltaproteobacteria bacterium]|nr:MAG: serine--tRNA ligase [Deltaproteobacteria bacterium]
MLDPRILADDPDLVKAHLMRRNADDSLISSVDRLVELRDNRNALIAEGDELRAARNTLSKQIGALMREGKRDEAEGIKAEVAAGKDRIAAIDEELAQIEAERHALSMALPNLLHDDVPPGNGDEDNLEVRRWGTPREDATESHVEIAEKLGILDVERSTKLAGARFAVLKGHGARLERALINFFLDVHTTEHGYEELMVPYIAHRSILEGTGQLPKFEADLFKLQGELNGQDAFLIPTAEVPVTNLHREEILAGEELPKKYCAFTPCFRSEAGSAGKDVRGLIRQHQFHKVELVWFVEPEKAEEAHEQLTGHAETILQRLGLPYRVMTLCGGDISFSAHKCYDLEVWLPSQGAFREISSCSNFDTFQARRMGLRYRPETDGKKAKPRAAATLNGSGLAVGRTLVAILENYVQDDGSVVIPEALRPWMGGIERITPKA